MGISSKHEDLPSQKPKIGDEEVAKNYTSKFAEDLEEIKPQQNQLKFIRDKNKIELMVAITQSGIIQDNVEEAKKIYKMKKYINKVRSHAVEHFGTFEKYKEAI